MKRVIRNNDIRLTFSRNPLNEKAIFIDLHGNSSSCMWTKKQAKRFASYLKEASKQVEQWSKELR